jgi:hypothetical protein
MQRESSGTPADTSNGAAALDYGTLMERAANELGLKTATAVSLFHIDEADWAVDEDAGTITFTASDIQATAPVQIIGTFNPHDSTWLWAWDHPGFGEPLRKHAETVRRYGQQQQIEELTQRKLVCAENDCWQFTALACCLNGAQGAYRGPAGGPFVFMTFGTVTLSKRS